MELDRLGCSGPFLSPSPYFSTTSAFYLRSTLQEAGVNLGKETIRWNDVYFFFSSGKSRRMWLAGHSLLRCRPHRKSKTKRTVSLGFSLSHPLKSSLVTGLLWESRVGDAETIWTASETGRKCWEGTLIKTVPLACLSKIRWIKWLAYFF